MFNCFIICSHPGFQKANSNPDAETAGEAAGGDPSKLSEAQVGRSRSRRRVVPAYSGVQSTPTPAPYHYHSVFLHSCRSAPTWKRTHTSPSPRRPLSPRRRPSPHPALCLIGGRRLTPRHRRRRAASSTLGAGETRRRHLLHRPPPPNVSRLQYCNVCATTMMSSSTTAPQLRPDRVT